MNLDWLETMISEYGYAAVLIGTFLEGESILVIAGYFAHMGRLELPTVMLCAFVGSLISDQLAFFIGRRWGMRWIERSASRKARFERARSLVDRHQTLMTLTFRFLYGLRNVIPFALGMSRMRVGKYMVLNVIGAAVWAVALSAGGYALGEAFEVVIDDVASSKKWFLVVLCLLAVGFWVFTHLRTRRRLRRQREEQEAQARLQVAAP
ncbi:MAG: DedA family protein, partial [Planctomycetes bacterium]|nr:DedA family protein [Planctomycetota bacterium]